MGTIGKWTQTTPQQSGREGTWRTTPRLAESGCRCGAHFSPLCRLRCQSGPLASVPFTVLPVHRMSRIDSELESCCCGASGSHYPLLSALASVAVLSTLFAIKERRARQQGRHEIWTSQNNVDGMGGGSRWLQKDCLSSGVLSWPSTQPWSQPCKATVQLGGRRTKWTG